jgi:DnaJ-class molecular chaperone
MSIELVVLGLALLAGYALVCRVWPYAACGRCDGRGEHSSPSGKTYRECRRCKGSGRRLRLGRRLWDHSEIDPRNRR